MRGWISNFLWRNMATILLTLLLLPGAALAGTLVDISGTLADGTGYTVVGSVLTVTGDGVALTGTNTSLAVVIANGKTLTLADVSITAPTGYPAIQAGDGCSLVLMGANSATGAATKAGVNVPSASDLTILGPGSLTATGGGGAAGIGGNADQANGTISISHATIIATGGAGYDNNDAQGGGAGIGSGCNEDNGVSVSGPITIVNASISATGGDGFTDNSLNNGGGGAGIGGGGGRSTQPSVSGENITIENSTVVATGGTGAGGNGDLVPGLYGGGGGSGIGGGGGGCNNKVGGAGEDITIDANSVVKATGGTGGSPSDANSTGGGGGAAIGSGGGGGNAAGGTVNNISTLTDTQLDSASTGGNGGTGGSSSGGDGALCGAGGAGNSATPGAEAQPGLTANGDVTSITHPDTTATGYSSGPTATNPTNQSAYVGNSATFSVTATGAPSYQWQKSTNGTVWTDQPGATAAALTLTNVQLADSGAQYRCYVFDSAYRVAVSNAATLTVTTAPLAPTVTTEPLSITVLTGDNAAFTAAATGDPTPTYQWQESNDGTTWTNITGATSGTLTLTNVALSQSGNQYRCVATNAAGFVNSDSATLTVTTAPVAPSIATEPLSITVLSGDNAAFAVTATGNPTPTYKWQESSNGTTWTDITGATSATLTLANVALAQSGNQYRCVVSNGIQPDATSNVATLTVWAITGLASDPSALASIGGASTITVTGANLPPTGLTVAAFSGTVVTSVTGTTTGSASSQTVTLSFPANESATEAKTYTIKVSTDGGTTYLDTPTATVTVNGTTPDPTEQNYFSVDSAEWEIRYYRLDDGRWRVEILIPFATNCDPALLATIRAILSFSTATDIAYLYVDENGDEHEISEKSAASRGAVSAPYLKIAFTVNDKTVLDTGKLTAIEYSLINDAIEYVQNYPGTDGSGLPLAQVAQIDTTPGGGSSGVGCGMGFGTLALFAVASVAICRKKRAA